MNRNSMVTVWIGTLALSLLVLGCPKKKPTAVPEMETDTRTVAPQEVPPPPAPVVEDETPDPFSQDIETANREAYARGLLGDVYYDFDKADLKPEARDRLARNAEFMRQYPAFVYRVEGHCDERGTNEYNIALGQRRANAAADYLVSLGIPRGRLSTISYGEERPVCTEPDETCWWRNRRAHFLITGRQ